MNVSLTPELERWVAEKVSVGRYRSASEVVREGLRLLVDREAEQTARLEALRRDIQVGLDELDRGEDVEGDEAFDRVLARIDSYKESAP